MVVRKHSHQHNTRRATTPFVNKYRGTLLYMKLTKDYGNIFPVVKLHHLPTALISRSQSSTRVKNWKNSKFCSHPCFGFNGDIAGARKNSRSHRFLSDDLKARCESVLPMVVVEDISKRLACRLSNIQWSILDIKSNKCKRRNDILSRKTGNDFVITGRGTDKAASKPKKNAMSLRSPNISDCNDCSVILERYRSLPLSCSTTAKSVITDDLREEDIEMCDTGTKSLDSINLLSCMVDSVVEETKSAIGGDYLVEITEGGTGNAACKPEKNGLSLRSPNLSDCNDCSVILQRYGSLPLSGATTATSVITDDLDLREEDMIVCDSSAKSLDPINLGSCMVDSVVEETESAIGDIVDIICNTVDSEDMTNYVEIDVLGADKPPVSVDIDNIEKADVVDTAAFECIVEDELVTLPGCMENTATATFEPVSNTNAPVREEQTYTLLFDDDPTKSEIVEIEQTGDDNNNYLIQDLTNLLISSGIRSSLTSSLQNLAESNAKVDPSVPEDKLPEALVQCAVCHGSFSTGRQIKDHKEVCTVMELRSNKRCSCRECTFSYQSEAELMRHAAYHNGIANIMCKVCGLTFLTSFSFDSHRRSHLGSS